MGIFPVLIAAGAVFFERQLQGKATRAVLMLLVVLPMLPLLPIGPPILKPAGLVHYFDVLEKKYHLELGRRFGDGTIHSLPQDYADMQGWKKLASITSKAYQQVPDKRQCVIYCENYGQAGAIYIIGKKNTVCRSRLASTRASAIGAHEHSTPTLPTSSILMMNWVRMWHVPLEK